MKRECPNCKEETISIFRLVLLNCKTRCNDCGLLVGTHWLINTLFFLGAFLSVLFAAFYLLSEFGLGIEITIAIVIIWVLAELMRVSLVPLESKESIIN
jgi:hypothetical protein